MNSHKNELNKKHQIQFISMCKYYRNDGLSRQGLLVLIVN